VHYVTAGIFDRVFHYHPLAITIDQTGGENLPERRTLVQRLNLFLIELVAPDPTPDLTREILRDDTLLPQRPESLKNYSHRNNRAKDNRQHQPATGFDYFNHRNVNHTENGNIQ